MGSSSISRALGIDQGKKIYNGISNGSDNQEMWKDVLSGSIGGGLQEDKKNQQSAQKAADESVAAAKKIADEQDQAFNKANQKKPNYTAIKSGNASSYGDTLLGGTSKNLLLGKNTLLGG